MADTTPDSTSVAFLGDYTLNTLRISSINIDAPVDISNLFVSMEIYESIYSPFMTYRVTIADNIGLMENFNMVGEEYLEIDIQNAAKQGIVSNMFYIYKITDRTPISDRGVSYTFNCIGFDALGDMNLKISKAFSGKAEDIIKTDIMKNMLNSDKPVFVEPTKNAIAYISNYWTPAQNIKFLTDRSVSSTGSSPSYVFYESMETYVFAPLHYLVSQAATSTYYYTVNNKTEDIDDRSKIIENLYVDVPYDYIDRMKNGAYGSRALIVNPLDKSYRYSSYDFLNSFDKFNRLNEEPFNSDNVTRRLNSYFHHRVAPTMAHAGMNQEFNQEWFAQRPAEMAAIEAQSIHIEVPGSFNLTAGSVSDISIYSGSITRKDNLADTVDRVLSGRYLVTAVRHFFDRQRHSTSLQLNKDSMFKPADSTTNVSTN